MTTYKGRGKQNGFNMGPAPLGGCQETGEVPSLWEPPSTAGRSARTGRNFLSEGSEQSVAMSLWRANREELRGPWPFLLAAVHSLSLAPAGMHSGWVLKLRFQQKYQEKGLGLAVGRQHQGDRICIHPWLHCRYRQDGGPAQVDHRSPLANAHLERRVRPTTFFPEGSQWGWLHLSEVCRCAAVG